MADENVVTRALGGFMQWLGSVTSSAAPDAHGTAHGWSEHGAAHNELTRITNEIERIDARIKRLRESIDTENARIMAETVPTALRRARCQRWRASA